MYICIRTCGLPTVDMHVYTLCDCGSLTVGVVRSAGGGGAGHAVLRGPPHHASAGQDE